MSATHEPVLLVTGASGHLGRRVIELLLEAGKSNIVAATRTPEKLADFAARGVIVRHADFDDPASLVEAFQGVDRLLLISTDAVGVPGWRIKQHLNAVKAAEEAGVKHVVYTSMVNTDPGSPVALAPDHYATEEGLRTSGIGWTVLRNNIYADILIGTVQLALQLGGQHFSAAADGKTAYITREDCARVAASALASSFEGRRTLDMTGPEALSQADFARIASVVTGQPVKYVPIPVDAAIDNMVNAGLPRAAAEVYASFDTGNAQGYFDVVSSGVQDLTGQSPTSVQDFLMAQREAITVGVQ